MQPSSRRDYHREYQRKLRQCPEQSQRIRERNIRSRYGITIDEYRETHAKQGGKCAICQRPITAAWTGGPMSGGRKGAGKDQARIDHCHTTGKVRGLLCNGCNSGLGSFYDNIGTMLAAIEYVERYARKSSH